MEKITPGFFLQLRLLLWKNFTIKRRSPVVFLVEVSLPLVLILILLLIRQSQHAYQIPISHYTQKPLPSAGIIPILQLFCDGPDDVYEQKNERLEVLLHQVQTVLEGVDKLQSAGFTTNFRNLPDKLEQLDIDTLLQSDLRDDITVSSLVQDKDKFRDVLQSYDIDDVVISSLLQSTLNTSHVYKTLELFINSDERQSDSSSILIEGLLILLFSQDAGSDIENIIQTRDVHKDICTAGTISEMFVPASTEDKQEFIQLEEKLCSMDQDTLVQLVKGISSTLGNDPDLTQTVHDMKTIVNGWMGTIQDQLLLFQGTELSSCHAHSHAELSKNITNEAQHKTKFDGLILFWKLLEPTLCSKKPENTEHTVKHGENGTQTEKEIDMELSSQQKKYLSLVKNILYKSPKILYSPNSTVIQQVIQKKPGPGPVWERVVHHEEYVSLVKNILYKSPKILYSPNTTVIQQVIQKANESFRLYDGITQYAKWWLNISDEVRHSVLKTASTNMPFKSQTMSQHPNIFINSTINTLDGLACTWLGFVRDINFDVFQGFQSESELEEYFLERQYHDNVTVIAGVVFEDIDEDMTSLPAHVRYKIRQNATLTPKTNLARSPIWFPSPGTNNIKYYDFGFVWIQDIIERTIIDLQVGNIVTEPGNYVKRIPYPCWPWDGFVWNIQHIFPLCLMLSWVYTISTLVQRIVYEKEKRLKEVMKMMGLSGTVHWCAWFITAFVQMTILVTTITLMLYYGRVLPYSNPVLVFVFLEVFAVSSISFSFLISSFYSKSRLAAACAGIFYFLTYVPYAYISIREDISDTQIPASAKLAASLFSTSAFGLGGKYFLYYEIEGAGVTWENFGRSPRENDDFSLLKILLMMIIDTVLYGILTWYKQNIYPGTYGIPKPWYFPVTKSYWFGNGSRLQNFKLKDIIKGKTTKKYTRLSQVDDDPLILNLENDGYFEEDTTGNPVGVEINNLTKVYTKGSRPAVDELNLTLYENQITAFLGHNGAGKTTTMSILTGLFPPTSGSATVYGHNICTEMTEVRKNLGMCPQHNVLFESLTVEEHLWFYARLKGMQASDIEQETDRMLRDLGLSTKKSTMPGCLSGGMQRKLSVAIAFVGGAKTVILDEPTAGVDPYSRRSIWKLLGQYKKGRTILLSTHHMDEADKLGDRIAIISNGSLKCCGSSLFLKNSLGDGQHIHILKHQDSVSNTVEDSSNTDDIFENIKHFVPTSFIKFESREEVIVTVPIGPTEKHKLAEICDGLYDARQELAIKSFGVNDSGLEEIFVKITQESRLDETDTSASKKTDKNKKSKPEVQIDDLHLYPINDQCDDDEDRNITGQQSTTTDNVFKTIPSTRRRNPFKHFRALFLKRIYYTLRNRKGVLSQIILPAVFVSISMTIALSAPKESDPPKMTMSTGQYYQLMKPHGNFIPLSVKNHWNSTFERKSASVWQIVDSIKSLPSGLGADCTLKSSGVGLYEDTVKIVMEKGQSMLWLNDDFFSRECVGDFSQKFSVNSSGQVFGGEILKGITYYPTCECKKYSQFVCTREPVFDPPEFETVTGDHIQNITGLNEEDFYLYTTQKYRLHRYGGLSLGHNLSYVPGGFGQSRSFEDFMRRLIVKDTAQIRFDQNGYHSMPIYINALNNAILRANLPKTKGNPASYGITLINHPMKKTSNLLDTDYINGGTDVLMGIFIIVAMSFVPASFVVFLVHERAIKAKHLQFISGVQPITYWLSNLIWDMVNYIIPATCIIGILLAFRIPAYVEKGNIEAVTALFLVYGWSITPMMYPATFIFKESSIAYISLIIVNLFTGITCVVTSFMLQLFETDKSLSSINDYLKMIFLVFPNFCLGDGLMEIALNQYENEFYFHIGQYDKIQSPMVWHLTGRKLVAMATTGVIFFIFTIFCEYRFFFTCRKTLVERSHSFQTPADDEQMDYDVLREKERVHRGPERDDLLRLVDLTKVYKTRKRGKIRAVNGLNLVVKQGECFGLLGVNGAGKTTTFKMLTGDIQPTSGDTTLLNFSVVKDKSSMYQHIGYCPQFDALFDELTPREHLQLYARLHGIPANDEEKVVSWALEKLGLGQYSNQTSGTLSGGNKRKLSTAISLVGNPTLIFMDEPTAGMDPYSKKFLWKTIHELIQDGKSVVFTSHSMEECEILCSRLSIMVNGQLKCLGSIQHLKDKFGEGYTLKIRLNTEDKLRKVLTELNSVFIKCCLKERGPKMVIFDVDCDWSKLAESYRRLDTLVCNNYIVDYSLSRNTLDNVFINFARQQNQSSSDITVEDENTETNVETWAGEPSSAFDEPLIELSPRGCDDVCNSDEEILPL